jgi:hypothetical protein
MGRGSYSGGSTVIRPGEDGTSWGSSDAAETKKRKKRDARARRDDERPPTSKEIELERRREEGEERKLLRSFISACVTAYAANKLTASEPMPPRNLRKRVANAGGNIKWLEGNRQYQVLFYEVYCHLCGRDIPFEKVWGPRSR